MDTVFRGRCAKRWMASTQIKKVNVFNVIVHAKIALDLPMLVRNAKTITTCKIHNAWQIVPVSLCRTSQMTEAITVLWIALS